METQVRSELLHIPVDNISPNFQFIDLKGTVRTNR